MSSVLSRTSGAAAIVAVVASVLAGCGGSAENGQGSVPTKLIKAAESALAGGLDGGGGSSADAGGGPASAPGGAAPGSTSATSAAPKTVDIGKSVYYGGFKVTLKTLTYTTGQGLLGGDAKFDVQFANEGTEATSFDQNTELDLAVGDTHYKVNNLDESFPQVPGQAQGEGAFAFIVDKTFTPDKATLTIGDAAHAQAVVPLGSTGTLVSLAPVDVKVPSTKITAGLLTITLRSAQLRADQPATAEQSPKDKRELILTFDAAMGSVGAGGFALIGTEVFSLKLPDGNSVTVDAAMAVNELLNQNTSKSGLKTSFTVDAPADGTYQLTVTGVLANLSDAKSKPASFTVTGSS